jgi:hypothetical protein
MKMRMPREAWRKDSEGFSCLELPENTERTVPTRKAAVVPFQNGEWRVQDVETPNPKRLKIDRIDFRVRLVNRG